MAEPTRGVRNNNPCNIRISPSPWEGKVTPSLDDAFEQFDTPEHGIRAAAKLFLTYFREYNLTTIQGLINRWAPPGENNTSSYVAQVSLVVGQQSGLPIDLTNLTTLTNLIVGVIWHENGTQPYPRALVSTACQDALSS
jgi:hypothetical protein